MKTAVIYISQTGFTKKYAGWIVQKSGADLFTFKEAKKKKDAFFAEYDAIIYAGWCMAGKVVKQDWFLQKAAGLKGKKLAIVAVGASPNASSEVETAMANLITEEQKQYVKVFYCQGGIDYSKMKLSSKMALKMFSTILKNSKDPKQREQGAFIDHSYDVSDIKFIDPVISFIS